MAQLPTWISPLSTLAVGPRDIGKTLSLSEPQFLYLKNGGDHNLFSIRWRTLNKVIHRAKQILHRAQNLCLPL